MAYEMKNSLNFGTLLSLACLPSRYYIVHVWGHLPSPGSPDEWGRTPSTEREVYGGINRHSTVTLQAKETGTTAVII